MRQPTPQTQLYSWHRDALDGLKPVIREDAYCGWYKRKLVKGGPWIPARIWMEQPIDEDGYLTDDEVMRCEINGVMADPIDEFSWLANNPITEDEYRYLVRLRKWADQNRTEHAHEAYDFNTIKPDF